MISLDEGDELIDLAKVAAELEAVEGPGDDDGVAPAADGDEAVEQVERES